MTTDQRRNPLYLVTTLALVGICILTLSLFAQDDRATGSSLEVGEIQSDIPIKIDRGNQFTINFWKSPIHSWTGYRGIKGQLTDGDGHALENVPVRLVRFDWIDASNRERKASFTKLEMEQQRDEWVNLGETVQRTDADGVIAFEGLRWGIYAFQPAWDDVSEEIEIIHMNARFPAEAAAERAGEDEIALRSLPWTQPSSS